MRIVALALSYRFERCGAPYNLPGVTFPRPGFPLALVVNVTGSFLLGAVVHVGLATQWLPPTLRLVLTTGVIGGFTTYSTFNYETLQYLRQGSASGAMLDIAATLVTLGKVRVLKYTAGPRRT